MRLAPKYRAVALFTLGAVYEAGAYMELAAYHGMHLRSFAGKHTHQVIGQCGSYLKLQLCCTCVQVRLFR